jgi:hypothetical protein
MPFENFEVLAFIEVDFEIIQVRKKDDCLAAYKEFGKSEAQKLDTSRGCEMVYMRKLRC